MKKVTFYLAICMLIMITAGCDEDQIIPGTGTTDEFIQMDARKGAKIQPMKITGFVELVWKGENKGGDMGNKPDELRTFMDITAIEGTANINPRGELVFTVLETDLSPHREIRAQILDVKIDPYAYKGSKGYVIAVVTYDSKGCAGNGSGGHEDSCVGSGEDPSSHDGGCSHEETDDEGGTMHDETDEGGCTHDETDEGGCSGSDDHGGSTGSDGKGNPASGKNCRVGQILALKTHDMGTPGILTDGIAWKWYDPSSYPSMEEISAPKFPLCKKEIIEGNIFIHIGK